MSTRSKEARKLALAAATSLLLAGCGRSDTAAPPEVGPGEPGPSSVLAHRPPVQPRLHQSSPDWKAVQAVMECGAPYEGKARDRLDQITLEREDDGNISLAVPTGLLVFGFQPASVSTSHGQRQTRFDRPADDLVAAVRLRYGETVPVTGGAQVEGGAVLQVRPGQAVRVHIDANTHQTAVTCEP